MTKYGVYIINAGWQEFAENVDGENGWQPLEGVVWRAVVATTPDRAKEIFIDRVGWELRIFPRLEHDKLSVLFYGYIDRQREYVVSAYSDYELWKRVHINKWHSAECEFWDMLCEDDFPDDREPTAWGDLSDIPF